MKFWKLTYSSDGKLKTCVEVADFDAGELVVRAENRDEAMRRGASLYARLQARLRRQQYALEGRCQCGHERDRAKSDGSLFLQCCACFNRQQRRQAKAKGDNAELRVLEPMPPTRVHGRHDGAALPSVGVQLQTLRAVKDQWIACRNVGAFGKWLLSQIESLERISSPESLAEAAPIEQTQPRRKAQSAG